jgi:transcription elongation factor Elf1
LDAAAEARVAQFGVATWFTPGRARCNHCGLRFSFRELPTPPPAPEQLESGPASLDDAALPTSAVAEFGGRAQQEPAQEPPTAVGYPVAACPQCGSPKIKVTSTRRPVRHHKCGACLARFKSVERTL